MSLKDKIARVVVEIYGGDKVEYTPQAEERIERYSKVHSKKDGLISDFNLLVVVQIINMSVCLSRSRARISTLCFLFNIELLKSDLGTAIFITTSDPMTQSVVYQQAGSLYDL